MLFVNLCKAGAYHASCASGASRTPRTPADSLAIFNHFVS